MSSPLTVPSPVFGSPVSTMEPLRNSSSILDFSGSPAWFFISETPKTDFGELAARLSPCSEAADSEADPVRNFTSDVAISLLMPLGSDSKQSELHLGTRIYEICRGDEVICQELDLGKGSYRDLYFRERVIPRMLEKRKEVLKESVPGHLIVVSSRNSYMQFPGYGKMSLRILPDGSTFIVLPGITPRNGGIKKVKYGVLISPREDKISLQVICKLRDGEIRVKSGNGTTKIVFKRIRHLPLFKGSFDIALKIPDHPNILFPTAMLSHPARDLDSKKLEMISSKCDFELFKFLERWRVGTTRTESEEESFIHIRAGFQYLTEITSAMRHLYQNGYLYCDLKTENVMFKKFPDGSLTTKLIDLDFLTQNGTSQKVIGTRTYLPDSPPKLTCNTLATDLYALGRVIRYKKRDSDQFMSPSFFDLFNRIENCEENRGNEVLAEEINRIVTKLCCLSDGLLDGSIVDYDTVLAELQAIETDFLREDRWSLWLWKLCSSFSWSS